MCITAQRIVTRDYIYMHPNRSKTYIFLDKVQYSTCQPNCLRHLLISPTFLKSIPYISASDALIHSNPSLPGSLFLSLSSYPILQHKALQRRCKCAPTSMPVHIHPHSLTNHRFLSLIQSTNPSYSHTFSSINDIKGNKGRQDSCITQLHPF